MGKKPKKIYQFDLEGNFIQEHKSSMDASKSLHINYDAIHSSIHSKCVCNRKFYFSRTIEFIIPDKKTRKIYQFDLEGSLIKEYKSITDASLFYKTTPPTIYNSILRKSCVKGRYYFSYNKKFNIPANKSQFNPLLSGGKNSLNFITDTDNEITNYD